MIHFDVLRRHLVGSCLMVVASAVLFGFLYPLLVSCMSVPYSQEGIQRKSVYSVTMADLAQLKNYRKNPGLFHPRPSTTKNEPYNISCSSSSVAPIYGLRGDEYIIQRMKNLELDSFSVHELLSHMPDAISVSSSGIDPHITYHNAVFQAERIAKARNCDIQEIIDLIIQNTSSSAHEWMLFPKVVNVVQLNQLLEQRDFSIIIEAEKKDSEEKGDRI